MFLNLLGSLGLFLLGMWLMTEGLKLSGGKALEKLLGKWTSNKLRGLASGVLITALVQSSSAVTIATLGFVNAGLMTFQRAVWVVFGSNLGTTFTAWIVTLFGFNLKLNLITFPLIGIGAILRIFSTNERLKALGMALAGFGLLFMGITSLNENFSASANQLNIEALLAGSQYQTLWALLIGFLLTLVTQSSSAAIAIILTAVASGVAGVYVAAAAVIGANIGTTSTTLIASIGATPNAKRLAWAHMAFNVLTAIVALIALPAFWMLVSNITNIAQMQDSLTMTLAIFHTSFNLLGILLMWPLEPKLSKRLLSLYADGPLKPSFATHLDSNVATVPDLAFRAMLLELKTLMNIVEALKLPSGTLQESNEQNINDITEGLSKVNEFIALSLQSGVTKEQGSYFTQGLRITHHLSYACELYTELLERHQTLSQLHPTALGALNDWYQAINNGDYKHQSSRDYFQYNLPELTKNYQIIKTQLLTDVISEKINIRVVDTALQAVSLSRRFIEQISQANDVYTALSYEEKPINLNRVTVEESIS